MLTQPRQATGLPLKRLSPRCLLMTRDEQVSKRARVSL
jgi:hypothetical protein